MTLGLNDWNGWKVGDRSHWLRGKGNYSSKDMCENTLHRVVATYDPIETRARILAIDRSARTNTGQHNPVAHMFNIISAR